MIIKHFQILPQKNCSSPSLESILDNLAKVMISKEKPVAGRDLPEVGKTFNAGDACAVVESVKAASDIYAPVAGEVIATNEAATAIPEAVNSDAYDAWLFKIKPADISKVDALLTAEAYGKNIGA